MTQHYYRRGHCRTCNRELLQSSTGRIKRFCDSRCRQKAYRKRVKEDELNGFYRVKSNTAPQTGTVAFRNASDQSGEVSSHA